MERVNVGIVGTGARGVFAFAKPLSENYADRVKIVALCDRNERRLGIAKGMVGGDVSTFTDYDAFLGQNDLDAVIVTTPDYTHADLAIRALDAGKHVFCEKPMATKAEDCHRMIVAAERSTGTLQVGLNLRYTQIAQQLIGILRAGDIGDVRMATAIETLEGASHFSRWHRKREFSGGILLQKGTHTLDLLNWILDSTPAKVAGFGGRDVFKAREECRDWRCKTCGEKDTCPYFRDVAQGAGGLYAEFYFEAEKFDGYIVDRCVFDPEADILDNAIALIQYEKDRRAAYTLSLFGAEHDRKFTIIGTEGKIDASFAKREIVIYKRGNEDVVKHNLETDTGGHGGGDRRIIDDWLDLMRTGRRPLADAQAGMWSVLVGLAAEESIEKGQPTDVAHLGK